MDNEQIKSFLAVWGAGLSTLLGILAVVKFRKENRMIITVIGISDEPFEHLRISACNIATKPATIVAYSIGIGASKQGQKIILKKELEQEKKLNESDIWTIVIPRTEIQSMYHSLGREQKFYQRLWVNVVLSSERIISNPVYIHPKIIQKEYLSKAEPFIATDTFLGLPQMDSIFNPVNIYK